jgi:hypothetical protein
MNLTGVTDNQMLYYDSVMKYEYFYNGKLKSINGNLSL